MADDRSHRFRLSDAMILVAATAIGLAPLRWTEQAFELDRLDQVGQGWGRMAEAWVRRWIGYAWPALYCWTLAVPILLVRHPRRPFRRVARCPGFITCAAASFGGLAIALDAAIASLFWPVRTRLFSMMLVRSSIMAPLVFGYLTLGAWIAIAFSGTRRRHMGWADSLGRLIGSGWIVILIVSYVRGFLSLIGL